MPFRVFAGPPINSLVYVDEESIETVEQMLKEQIVSYKKEETEAIFLDAGGAVYLKEPLVDFEANGTKFTAYARHLPIFLEVLSNAASSQRFPGRILLAGRIFNYILAVKTRDEMLPLMQKLIQDYAGQIDEAERKIEAVFSGHPNLARKATCVFCGSNKPYSQCCGSKRITN